jgi:hypothetical protein
MKIVSFVRLASYILLTTLPAMAQNSPDRAINAKYLALGDSIALGFDSFVNPPDLSKYMGYPQILSSVLRIKLANAACPGETSSSFVDATNPLPGFSCGSDATATVFGPSGPVLVPMPLFVPYNSARSQLDYTVNYLKSNSKPKLLTISIGGNDLAPLLTCTSGCDALAAALLRKLRQNLTLIYSAIRSAGYDGPMITTNYYAFDYKDPRQVGSSGAFSALNATIAQVASQSLFHAAVADVFGAFQLASGSSGDPCTAGLLKKIPNSTACDTHPSLLGHAIIAGTVAYQAR